MNDAKESIYRTIVRLNEQVTAERLSRITGFKIETVKKTLHQLTEQQVLKLERTKAKLKVYMAVTPENTQF